MSVIVAVAVAAAAAAVSVVIAVSRIYLCAFELRWSTIVTILSRKSYRKMPALITVEDCAHLLLLTLSYHTLAGFDIVVQAMSWLEHAKHWRCLRASLSGAPNTGAIAAAGNDSVVAPALRLGLDRPDR